MIASLDDFSPQSLIAPLHVFLLPSFTFDCSTQFKLDCSPDEGAPLMCGWCFQEEVAKEDFKPTCEFIKKVLGKAVDKVDVSSRLTSSPSALVQPQWGMSPQMQRFMKAQASLSP